MPYPNLEAAVSAWRAAHPLPLNTPHAHAKCPVCGCGNCWGRLPSSEGWWFCFNTESHPVGIQQGGEGWAGDTLDLEVHRRGYRGKTGRVRVLREDGYLEGSRPRVRSAPAPSRPVVLPRQRRPQRPPRREVEALWSPAHTLEPGRDDLEALEGFYQAHEIPGATVTASRLACVLPPVEELPPWLAEPRGVPLALPLYDERGRLGGLWPVAALASPEGYTLRGLMAVDPCARGLIRGEDPVGRRWNGRVVVATTPGEFLRWACCEGRHAVLGAWAPCWGRAASSCLPSEAEVIIRGPRPEPVAGAFLGRFTVRY